ncbi:MAG TPA: L-lactate dehydrogenase [Bacteroidales bacterium]|nr:L-lactate dehydrogenase [Bacteroidales bacterium]
MSREENADFRRKVVVVGAGSVGATYCYALAQSGLANEIVLYDRNEDLMKGQVLDLVHGQPFFPTVIIRSGTPEDYNDANIIVISAGSAQKPGETRLQLLKKNAEITGGIAEEVAKHNQNGVILVVSNPVDVLTYVALKRSGWDRRRVIGSGTVLDSSRFRHLLGTHCGVDVHNVHAYILGEHGDSEFAAWSMTHVAGMKIEDYCPFCNGCKDWAVQREEIEKQVRESAYHIINYKGATHYAIGLALTKITGALLRNQHSVLTVSTMLEGEFGINDVCISVPCIVTDRGIHSIIQPPLNEREIELLNRSANILKEAVKSI